MTQPKPTSYHHGDLDTALVEAATRLVEERGLASFSLREVARVVGVSHAAPYRHFPNRQALLEAVAIQGFHDLSDALDAVIRQHPDDPRQQMIAAGATYVLEAINHPNRAQLMLGSVLPRGAQTAKLQAAAEASFSRCIAVIQQGQQQGTFRQDSTREMVLTYWAASHGLAMLLIANRIGDFAAGDDAEALWHHVADNLLAGFLAEPGRL